MLGRTLIAIALLFCSSFAFADVGSINGVDVSGYDSLNGVSISSYASWNSVDIAVADFTQDANCQGAWYANSNGGNETDRSGNSETLTQTGGTIPTSATVPGGYSGTSRDFEFVDSEYLEVADGGSTDIYGADQAVSLCVWWRPEDIPSDQVDDMWMIGKGSIADGTIQYHLKGTSADKIEASISSDGTTANESTVTSSTSLVNNTWIHACLVYNDTDLRLYINGSSEGTPAAHTGGISNESGGFRVGSNNVKHADGLFDEAIVFNRALSASEASDIHSNGIDGTKGAND